MSHSRSRLVWLCRRGTRELDLLLRSYLEQAYDDASATDKIAFAGLLEKPDTELHALFFEPARAADSALKPVVDRILASAANHP